MKFLKMKSMKKLSILIVNLIFTIGTIGLYGCSNDSEYEEYEDGGDGTPVEISVSLSAVRSNSSAGDGLASNPASDNEKINSWWIAFVDKSGMVRKILKRSDSETGIPSQTGAVEEESFKCLVSPGVYDIYAFANITAAELKTATGLDFIAGRKVTNVDNAVWSPTLNNYDSTKPLPMSGFRKSVRVKNKIEENFTIEVVRMVAKMEFLVRNVSGDEVTLHAITVDPVTSSSVSLFPRGTDGISYDHLGKSAYTPLDDPTYAPLKIAIDGGKTFGAGDTDTKESPEAESLFFYLQESLSVRENNNAFTIGLNVSHKNNVAEYEQFNITSDILSYINRNDHIVIPVDMSRYYVEVVATGYPPIGGYPAVVSTTDPKGAQIFTFATGGDFSIVAHVTDKQTGLHLSPAYYKITLGELEGDTGIFQSAPVISTGSVALPDEVTGVLGNLNGTAAVTLKVAVYDKPHYETGAKVTNIYTRKIYIVRKTNS